MALMSQFQMRKKSINKQKGSNKRKINNKVMAEIASKNQARCAVG